MEEDAAFSAEGADLGHRLHGPDLVVRRHHRNEGRVGADRGGDVANRDQAVGGARHLEAVALERPTGSEDGRVLDRRGDEVPARRRGARDTANREVSIRSRPM